MEGLPSGYRPNVGICLINHDNMVRKSLLTLFNCLIPDLINVFLISGKSLQLLSVLSHKKSSYFSGFCLINMGPGS